jgi:muramidase (phage lysozyme)
MTEIRISDKEMQLLSFVARGEATAGVDPYISVVPNTYEPQLTQMTLAEVDRFQTQRIAQGSGSAAGRYQFIRKTLRYTIGLIGIDTTRIRYTPDVQDALIMYVLRTRQSDQWLAGTLSTDRFMIKLAQEFASMPVPYPMTKPNGTRLSKGESYYSDTPNNRSKVDPGPRDPNRIQKREAGTDTLYQELEDIRTAETGNIRIVSLGPEGPNTVAPAAGTTPRAQVSTQAAGVGVGAYTGGNAGSRPLPSTILPPATGAVYQYRITDPLDDRYDFRTGEKVKDLGIHGTGPAAASPVINGNIGAARVATTNTGAEPPVQEPAISNTAEAQAAELQSNLSEALNTLTDPTSVLSNLAERASSLFDESGINSALTGGLSTSATDFASAVVRQPEVLRNAEPTVPTRTDDPRPVSATRPTRPGQTRSDKAFPLTNSSGPQ